MFGALIIAPKSNLFFKFSRKLQHVHAWIRMSDFRKFTDSCVYVAFPDKPAYFTKRSCVSPSRDHARTEGDSVSKFITKGYDYVMLQPHVEAQECLERYIKTGIDVQKIIRKLPEFSGGWALCYSTADQSHHMDTTHGGSPKRGVFLYIDNSDQQNSDTKKKILNIAKDHGLKTYCQFINTSNNVYKRQVLNLNSNEKEEITEEEEFVFETTAPLSKLASPKRNENVNVSAIFSDVEYSPVFSTYKRSRSVLQKVRN